MPTADADLRRVGTRSSIKLSITNGDVALEMVNDHPSRSCMTGLVCCISVRGPWRTGAFQRLAVRGAPSRWHTQRGK